jgi:hypothetical protein
MSHNPNIERAARVVAAAIVHGTSSDMALEVAQHLDDAGLLVRPGADPFTAPGRKRPAPSPTALAALADCKRAKYVADGAQDEIVDMPGKPDVWAAGGEVRIVVHPRSLAEWRRWTYALGVADARGVSTGAAMIVRCTYGGVRARLIGYGVPAMFKAQLVPAGVGA